MRDWIVLTCFCQINTAPAAQGTAEELASHVRHLLHLQIVWQGRLVPAVALQFPNRTPVVITRRKNILLSQIWIQRKGKITKLCFKMVNEVAVPRLLCTLWEGKGPVTSTPVTKQPLSLKARGKIELRTHTLEKRDKNRDASFLIQFFSAANFCLRNNGSFARSSENFLLQISGHGTSKRNLSPQWTEVISISPLLHQPAKVALSGYPQPKSLRAFPHYPLKHHSSRC